MRLKPVRLQENEMALLVREAHHFVLEGGAVTGPRAGELSVEERRTSVVDGIPNDLVGPLIGVGEAAAHLRKRRNSASMSRE